MVVQWLAQWTIFEIILKIILDKPLRSPSENNFADIVQLLTFNRKCMYRTAVLVYKTLNNMSPSYLSESLTVSNNTV